MDAVELSTTGNAVSTHCPGLDRIRILPFIVSDNLAIPSAEELKEPLQKVDSQDPFAYFFCAQFDNRVEGDEADGF
ncbi:hypothetical protein AB0E08_13635 [Streptomyces sp. NPDC048281]|uniref:hypothetical protein n=1 Tax=Streptomyces sp. NPDC048281 TaxID=3154715 RepID=UPI00341CD0E8